MSGGFAGTPHPPGPCPFRANSTRCSGVKSRNNRFGSGGRGSGRRTEFVPPGGTPEPAPAFDPGSARIRSGPGGSVGKSEPNFMPDCPTAWVRPDDRANHHHPPAASTTAIARRKCFLFICRWVEASRSPSSRHPAPPGQGWRAVWNEGGKSRREPPAAGNEPRPARLGSTPGTALGLQPRRRRPKRTRGLSRCGSSRAREGDPGLYRNSSRCWISRIGRVVG